MKRLSLHRGMTAALIGVACWGLSSCDQNEAAGQSSPPPEKPQAEPAPRAEETAVVPAPEAPAPEATASEVKPNPKVEEPEAKPVREQWALKHAGFAAHLPPDVSFYADARQLEWIWNLLEDLNIGKELKELSAKASEAAGSAAESAEVEGMDVEAALELGKKVGQEAQEVVPALLAEETFVAVRGLEMPFDLMESYVVLANRYMGRFFTEALANGEFLEAAENRDEVVMKEIAEMLGTQVQERLDAAEGKPPLAVYAGGRVADDKREAVMTNIKGWLADAVESSEEIEACDFEKFGAKWTGLEIAFPEAEEVLKGETFNEFVTSEMWQLLVRTAMEWKVVVACAEVDGFVVLYAGLGEYSLELVSDPAKSLAARDAFEFYGEFDPKTVYGTYWMDKELLASGREMNSYLHLFRGIEEGLKLSENLTMGAEMVKAIGELNAHWEARREGVAHDLAGAVIFDGGLRSEARGGWEDAGLDLDSPLQFTKAFEAMDEDLFLRAHWRRNESYIQHGRKRVDAGMKLLGLVGDEVMHVLSENLEDDAEEAEDMVRWRRDLGKGIEDIWKGYREHLVTAFGPETAFLMDLKGVPPAAVGMDLEVIEKGKIPRLAYVRPVKNREPLSETWDLWNSSVTNLFGIVAEAFDQPIPFPDTMTAEKNDLSTTFFTFPFASDDFLPSVSVSDKLFIIGSSKTFSEALYEASVKQEGDAIKTGVWLELNMDAFWTFCEAWIEVKEKDWEKGLEIERDELERMEDPDSAEEGEDRAGELKEEELPDGLRELLEEAHDAEPEAEERPVAPDRLKLPEDGNANPLFEELLKEEGEPAVDLEVEMDADGLEELLAEEEEFSLLGGGLFNFFDAGDGNPAAELQQWIDRARWFRGASYRRWRDEGVPRTSWHIKWAAPGEPRP